MERKKSFIIFLVLLVSVPAFAQLPFNMANKVPNYIDVNNASLQQVYEMRNSILSIAYHDQIGYAKSIALQFFNWKKEVLGTYNLQKEFGLNQFNIDLTSLS